MFEMLASTYARDWGEARQLVGRQRWLIASGREVSRREGFARSSTPLAVRREKGKYVGVVDTKAVEVG